MSSKNFQELYCEQHNLDLAEFERAAFRESLYWHARLVHPLVRLLCPDHFVADMDLVRGTGLLRRVRDFRMEAEEFTHHPANRGAMRRTFNVRVSTKRLRHMLRVALHGEEGEMPEEGEDGTVVPFSEEKKPAKGTVDVSARG